MMTMVAKTGLLTEVSASHIDQHPFHQIVLSRGHDDLLFLQSFGDLHELPVFPTDLDFSLLCPISFNNKELGSGVVVEQCRDRGDDCASRRPSIERHPGE